MAHVEKFLLRDGLKIGSLPSLQLKKAWRLRKGHCWGSIPHPVMATTKNYCWYTKVQTTLKPKVCRSTRTSWSSPMSSMAYTKETSIPQAHVQCSRVMIGRGFGNVVCHAYYLGFYSTHGSFPEFAADFCTIKYSVL